MGAKSFRELEVWRESMDLVVLVYGLLDALPNHERFALCDQLRRAVISIPSNIAEGFGRDSHKDFGHFLSIARGSLYEVDTQLEIAERMGYLAVSQELRQKMNTVSRLIAALNRRLRTAPSTTPAPSTTSAPRTSAADAKAPSTSAASLRASTISPFRIMLNFAWSMVDKMDACCLRKSLPKMTVKGDEAWMKGGCFLLATHVGCIEVLPALGTTGAPAPLVHAFQQMGRDEIYMSFFTRHLDRSLLSLHAVEDIGVETAVEMKEAIGRGEIVLMAADRMPAKVGRTAGLSHDFLGRACVFPKGVFRFAKLMECPVYAITCVRVGWNAYEVEAKRLGADLLGDYVAFLESAARRHPDQWYQFYDFFAGAG